MPYTTLVTGTTITASWANANVRDQAVTPFATSSARSAAITSPVEGMMSYLSDSDRIDTYDGAAWVTVGWGAGQQFARKTADETRASNTLTNDTHLSVPVAASATYLLESQLFYISADQAEEFKVDYTFPTGATLSWAGWGLGGSATVTADHLELVSLLQQTSAGGSLYWGTVNGFVSTLIRGVLIVSTTAGTLQCRTAQANNSATLVTIKQDSWLRIQRVA
jgi:hypothetical protein